MLINAQRAEQLRVAIVDGPILKDYHIEIADRDLTRGNIYRGVVANIQPSLGAAFIDIGEERHGFLPAADVVASAYQLKPPANTKRPRVDQLLERGKPILVQVAKDGVGQKGPALHTNLALAGRYLVLTPYDDVRGISRKAVDDKKRKTIRERLKKLDLPEGIGAIVRTNGIGQNMTVLNRDLNALLRLWKRVRAEANKGKGPRLLYSDQDLVVQALRDYLDSSIAEVLVDSDEVYEKAESYMRAFMPRSKTRLIRYEERLPLFSRYRIETQIDSIYKRVAPLPSGGSLSIDGTEALTAIDVNSGRATRADDHDETILAVNIEAAKEAARQLRLRDIGGLVVIDFIDMRYRKHQSKLEKVMRDAMKDDSARYTVGKISPNGLLEINRQRIKQALQLRTHRPCPACQGAGTVATAEFTALNLLRRIEARAATGLFEGVTVALHPEIADSLQNRHRSRLARLEEELEFVIEIVSAPNFLLSEDRFDWRERESIPEAVAKRTGSTLSPTDLAIPERRRKQAKKEEASSEAQEAPKKRRRRRRRSNSKAKEEAVSVAPDEQAESEAEGEAEGEEKPKRARRRRRSPRRKVKGAETAGQEDAAAPEAQPQETEGDAAEADEGASKSRSRRSSRSRTTRGRASKGRAATKGRSTRGRTAGKEEETEAARSEDGSRNGDGGTAVDPFWSPETTSGDRSPELDSGPLFETAPAAADETAEVPGGEVTKRRRRRSPRRKPRVSDPADAAESESKPSPVAAEPSPRPFRKEDWYGPRSVSRADDAPASGGSAERESARNESGSAGAPPESSRKPASSPSRKPASSPSRKPAPSPSRSSGTGPDEPAESLAPPSRRLRWQWFGGPGEDAGDPPRKDRGIVEPPPAADDEG